MLRRVIINLLVNVIRAHSGNYLNNHALILINGILVSKYFSDIIKCLIYTKLLRNIKLTLCEY